MSINGTPHKACPRCGQSDHLQATVCQRCGHQFRSQFDVPQQTQVFPPLPPPTFPPQMLTPSPGYLPPGYYQAPPGTHSVGVAVLLSLVLTGAGQFFNRQTGKGCMFLFGGVGVVVFSLILSFFTFGLALLLIPAWWIWALVDAALIGSKINRGVPVGPWDFS